jgi:hypothetical protein
MHHSEPRYGFSFDLPDGWLPMALAGRHFECQGQHIQMTAGPALPEFTSREARVELLWEQNARVVDDARLGEEPNTVLIVNDDTGAAAISTVRDRLHYFFEFDGFKRTESRLAIECIQSSFVFPTKKLALQIAGDYAVENLAPRTIALRRAMASGSAEEASRILSQAGIRTMISPTDPTAPKPGTLSHMTSLLFWAALIGGLIYWLNLR